MNLVSSRKRPYPHGSTLMVTLLVTLLLGLVLAGYLTLIRSEHALTARSQAWNNALVLAEAGVEEALAQLNPGALTSQVPAGNGWSLTDGLYRSDPPERELLGGSYAVVYTPTNPPTIYSTGYTTFASASATLARVVRVTTTNAPLLSTGLSLQRITNPSGVIYSLDSYDSTLPAYNDAGHYNPDKAKTSATINPPTITRIEFPDVLPPFATALPLPTKTNNTYSLSGNYYIPGNFNLPNSDRIYVPPNRTAVIYITGNVSMSTDAEIEIAPTGTLQLYVAGGRATIDYINNHGTPHNFQYYGLPGNTNVALTQTTPELAASIYAPQATFSAINDGSLFNYSGALVVNNLLLTRPFKFHFDESLSRDGLKRGFVVASWTEL